MFLRNMPKLSLGNSALQMIAATHAVYIYRIGFQTRCMQKDNSLPYSIETISWTCDYCRFIILNMAISCHGTVCFIRTNNNVFLHSIITGLQKKHMHQVHIYQQGNVDLLKKPNKIIILEIVLIDWINGMSM